MLSRLVDARDSPVDNTFHFRVRKVCFGKEKRDLSKKSEFRVIKK